ncbi:MAG: DUF1538 family protein [Ruminococcus sp.]|nr:DUF1538 family protein [Ruminococcus sp.]
MTDRPIKNKYIMICEKLSEAAKSVIPIVAVVLVLSLTIAPIPTDLMLSFLLGTLFLVLGMGLFSLGAEMSMTPVGSKIGTSLTTTKNLPLILIVAVANEDRTDTVMNAARAAGAAGGTVIHGKGTASEEAAHFFNISIASEKEMIFIVSKKEQKAQIMRSVLEKAGPGTEAGAVLFSLPVTSVEGFGLFED